MWPYFSISGKHSYSLFLIFVFCPSQIKNYIITGLVNNFLMHLVKGRHIYRKENTIRDFARNLLRRNRQRYIFSFHISFLCLTWDTKPGHTSNKPTHYQLDYGDLISGNTIHSTFSIFSPLNVMERFTLEQRWDCKKMPYKI